jgi:hypothetical protein
MLKMWPIQDRFDNRKVLRILPLQILLEHVHALLILHVLQRKAGGILGWTMSFLVGSDALSSIDYMFIYRGQCTLQGEVRGSTYILIDFITNYQIAL